MSGPVGTGISGGDQPDDENQPGDRSEVLDRDHREKIIGPARQRDPFLCCEDDTGWPQEQEEEIHEHQDKLKENMFFLASCRCGS